MKVSLVCPLRNEAQRIGSLLSDLEFFFKKFPLKIEVIFVLDPSSDGTESELLPHLARLDSTLTLRLLKNEQRLGRGPSLLKGLQASNGDFLFPIAADLNIPLSEIFGTLQEFMIDPNIELILGDSRSTKHKKRLGKKKNSNIWGQRLQQLSTPQWLHAECDPLSPFFGIRRTGFQKLDIQDLPSWFYLPCIYQLALRRGVSNRCLEILVRDNDLSQFSLWREGPTILRSRQILSRNLAKAREPSRAD